MIDLHLGRYALGVSIAAILVGCFGSQPGVGTPGAVTQNAAHRVAPQTSYGNCPQYSGGTGILSDGDFSQAANPGNHNITYYKGAVFAPAWKVSKGNIDFNGTTYWDLDGLCSVDLDGFNTVGGIVTNAFSTKKNATYTVSFVMSGNPDGPPTVKKMKVQVGSQFTIFTWDTSNGHDVRHGVFATETWKFTASRLTAVKFASQDPPGSGCGAVIGGVSVTKAP